MIYYLELTHLILSKNLTLTIVLLIMTTAIMTIPNMAFAQDDFNTLISKGRLFAQASNIVPFWWQPSFDNFDKALKIDPKNVEAQKGKDNAYNKIHEIKTSLVKYDDLLQKDPNSREALVGECNGLTQLHEYDKAIPYCEKAIKDQNQLTSENFFIVMSLQELGRYDEIYNYYMNSPHEIGNTLQYVALYDVGKYDDLIKMIDNDNQMSNGQYRDPLLLYKAATLEKMGKTDEANTYFSTYVNTMPNPDMNCFKGSIFSGLRDFEKAIYYLDKCKIDDILLNNDKAIAHAEIDSKTEVFYSQPSNMNFFNGIIQFFKNLFHTK